VKQILRAALVSSLFASSLALAQGVEMNMNVEVDEDGMPAANIQMQGTDENGQVQGVNMRVRGGTTSTSSSSSSSTTSMGVGMEVKVRGTGMQQPQPQPAVAPAPARPMPPPPPPAPAFRDCGVVANDPGCTMMRDGKYPMDAETWRGFYQSLKSQPNEISREEMAEKMLKRNYLTAAQYGLLLDLFANEISRLDVAKTAAPRVVNPQHALGFSSKWQNSISAEEYTEMIAEQQP
jgi:hypothetical protein